jgi:alpha-beta hydrolase superfamily lysophospholipase
VTLHVRTFGAGDRTALCLHGVGRTGELYARLATALPDWRLVAFDLRGHGLSYPEPPWRIEQHTADVLETLGADRPDAWIGHSFGGRLVVELANREPALVLRAVLLDPAIRMRPDIALAEADAYISRPAGNFARPAAIAMLGELAGRHARVEAMTMPTLLVVPHEGGVVGPRQLAFTADACPALAVARVSGDHHVLETAFDETADAVRAFLS